MRNVAGRRSKSESRGARARRGGSLLSFVFSRFSLASTVFCALCISAPAKAVVSVPDTRAPNAATGLAWSLITYSTTVSLTARWKKSSSADLASESVQFYEGLKCVSTSGSEQSVTVASDQVTASIRNVPFTGANGVSYSYKIKSVDTSGNARWSGCSLGITVDLTAPTAAANPVFSAILPRAKTLTANWVRSAALDLGKQVIEYFSDSSCATSASTGSRFDLGTRVIAKHSLRVTAGNTYYFSVTSYDKASNSATSACSSGAEIDGTAPTVTINQATGQSDPTAAFPVQFRFVFSESIDPVSFIPKDIFQRGILKAVAWTITDTGDHQNFDVTAVSSSTRVGTIIPTLRAGSVTDVAGNKNTASTSVDNTVSIDSSGPTGARALGWAVSSPHGTNAPTAQWTKSASSSVVTQKIQYYAGTACQTSTGSLETTESAAIQTHTFTSSSDGYYTYRITSVDQVNNSITSACSSALRVDTAPPTVAIARYTGQGALTKTLPIRFLATFSEKLIASSLTSADISNTGSAADVTWTVANTGDDINFVVSATAIGVDGTVEPLIAEGGATDLAGLGNLASTSEAIAVDYDSTVPTVLNVSAVAGNGFYNAGDAIELLVEFSEAVTVVGAPLLKLETGATNRNALYTRKQGTSALVFTYTVQSGDESADLEYLDTASLSLGGGTIKDPALNAAVLTLPALGSAGPFGSLGGNQNLVIDTQSPEVDITAPSAVNTTTDSPYYSISGTCSENGQTVQIFVDGSSDTAGSAVCMGSAFSGSIDSSALTEGTHALTATISDLAGNSTSSASVSLVRDVTVPILSLSAPSGTRVRSATSVTFTVSLSGADSVELSADDLQFSYTGDVNCSGAVSGSGTSTRTVTLSGCSGNGSVSVSIAAGTASDAAANFAGGAGPSAEVTIDNTAPTVAIGEPSDDSINSAGSAAFEVTYVGADSVSLVVGNISLNMTGTASCTKAVSGTGFELRTVTLSNCTGSGTVGISVGAGTASDLTGNLASSASDSTAFSVDNTAPTIAIGEPSQSSANIFQSVSYSVTYGGADSVSLAPENITLNKTETADCSVSVTVNSPDSATITLSSCSGSGTVSVSIAGGTGSDLSGNSAAAVGPSTGFTVSNSGLAVTIASPEVAINATNQTYYTVSGVCSEDSQYIFLKSGDATLTWTSCSASAWSVNVDLSLAADGPVTLTAELTDSSWNWIATATQTFTKDTTVPTVAFAETVTAINNANKAAYPVSGTCTEDSRTVTIKFTDSELLVTTLATATCASLAWSATVNLTSVTDGTISLTADHSDAAGNSATASQNFTKDTVLPFVGFAGNPGAVDAEATHSCAVVSGGAWCWGGNSHGQLGNNSITESSTPVAVQGLSSGVQAISVGEVFSCAVVNGGVKCWGDNQFGKLGDGSQSSSRVPVDVQGLSSGVTALSVGLMHACAVVNGGAKCWGYNPDGRLGNNSTIMSLVPVDVQDLSFGVTDIAASDTHSCAVINGAAKCWGYNNVGRLGDGTYSNSLFPIQVVGLESGVTAIAAAYHHSCALVSGGVQCWGMNTWGRLGNSSTTQSNLPVSVDGLNYGVQSIAAGGSHSCAVFNGGAWCWGYNEYGKLGDGTTTNSSVPVQVQGLSSGVQAMSIGNRHSCAFVGGGVQCWGQNTNGKLGNGSAVTSIIPVNTVIPATSGAVTIADTVANSSNIATYPISGTCAEYYGTVTINRGVETLATATCWSTWSVNVDLTVGEDGGVTLTADHLDSAGNSAGQASLVVIKDTVAPTVAITSATPTINLANQGSYTVSGTCSENSRPVTVSAISVYYGMTVIPVTQPICAAGGFSATIDIGSFYESAYYDSVLYYGVTFSASQSDNAGNSFTATSAEVVKDATAPTVTVEYPLPTSISSSTDTATYALTISGADTVNLTVSDISWDTSGTASCSKTLNDDGLGNRSVTLSSCSGSGSVGISIAAGAASDLAGNLSAAAGSSTQIGVDVSTTTTCSGTTDPSTGICCTEYWTGTYCISNAQHSCESGGGMWDSYAGSCFCSAGIWNGSSCDTSGGGGTSEESACTSSASAAWNGTSCTCTMSGYSWNGTTCEMSNFQDTCSGGRSWNSATSSCDCSAGYTWNESSCISNDQYSCESGGHGSWYGYYCSCSMGYTLNGTTCEMSGNGGGDSGQSACTSGGGMWTGTSCYCSWGYWNGSSCSM